MIDQLAALDLLNLAGEQLADLGRELVADAGALAFADALDDALLGRLHGEPAELDEIDASSIMSPIWKSASS